jgi:anti-sigma regulatory factor (Ser/Thr protein kinase)/CheY-like chemotaxis protein
MTPGAMPACSSQRALLVGSDPEVESALNAILGPGGWTLDKAADNENALDLAETRGFGLIVTSRHTSGREDVEFLRKLRKVRPHTRIIILANESTTKDVIASMRESAFGYLSKDFSFDALKDTVQMALESPCWDDGIEVVSATPEWIRLHVRCDLQTADRLLQFMREISDLPEEERCSVGAAFRELLLNAMEHGGRFDPSEFVEISYVRTRYMVLCRIKDPGQGFTLEELRHAAISNPTDPSAHLAVRDQMGLRPGGFGVMMAKRLVDEIVYGEKGNEVLLVKYLHTQTESSVKT